MKRTASSEDSSVCIDLINDVINLRLILLETIVVPLFDAIFKVNVVLAADQLFKFIASHACILLLFLAFLKDLYLLSTINGGIQVVTRKHSHSHL